MTLNFKILQNECSLSLYQPLHWQIYCFCLQEAFRTRFYVFGYNNLHVATAHEDLGYALYVHEYSTGNFDEARYRQSFIMLLSLFSSVHANQTLCVTSVYMSIASPFFPTSLLYQFMQFVCPCMNMYIVLWVLQCNPFLFSTKTFEGFILILFKANSV